VSTPSTVLLRHFGHWATAKANDLTVLWLVAQAARTRMGLSDAQFLEALLQAFVEQHKEDQDVIAVGQALMRTYR
jgi:hypothetical protein